MADPTSPSSAASSAPLFARKGSAFSSKGTALTTVADAVEDDQDPYTTANASQSSLASSGAGDSSAPRRSLSLRSHKSQSSGSLHVQKGRSPSLALPPTFSPPSPKSKKSHRLSRSISAGVSTFHHSPQRSRDASYNKPLPERGAAPAYISQPVQKAPYHMFSASRRPSEAPAHFGHGLPFAGGPGAPPLPSNMQASWSPLATYNHIFDTCNKRMATIDYIRKVYAPAYVVALFVAD